MNAVKRAINNIAGICIIYKASDPSRAFLETKTPGYTKAFVGSYCLMGGNWILQAAANDGNTRGTVIREVCREELSFEKSLEGGVELKALGLGDDTPYEWPKEVRIPPTQFDNWALDQIKITISGVAQPFGDYILSVDKSVFAAADPDSKKESYTGLASYFAAGLPDNVWDLLERLQNKFGNLSNESRSFIASLDDLLTNQLRGSWGHDRVLRDFFLSHGLATAELLPLVPGITAERVHMPLATYDPDYLSRYDVAKKPDLTSNLAAK